MCSKYFYNHLKSFCSNTSKYLKSHSSLLHRKKIRQKILASTVNYICFPARASGFLADISGRSVIPEALISFSWEFCLAYIAKWEMDSDVPTLYDIWESNFAWDLQGKVLYVWPGKGLHHTISWEIFFDHSIACGKYLLS